MKAVVWVTALALAVTSSPSWAGGTVLTRLEAPSPLLGHPIAYQAYLPAEAPPPGARWPVIYLLHGYSGTEREWFGEGDIAPLLDEAIASGKIPPAIVVTPYGGNSWYIDNPDQNSAGMVETALATDLVAAVDTVFPTLACREARIIGGLSMGGTGAVRLGLDHPEVFASAISLSGRFPPLLDNPSDKELFHQTGIYGSVFGRPLDPERFNQGNVLTHIKKAKAGIPRVIFFLHVGDIDDSDAIEGAARLHRKLQEAYIGSRFRVIGGSHDFGVWRAGLMEALAFLAPKLVKECPTGG